MLSATRRWLNRNRTPLAVGVGLVGAGYVAVQYLASKIRDDRERLSSERIAKENLRRRFEQNQEDCTFTVLALLPTATANIIDAMDTERITIEIQQMRGTRISTASTATLSGPPSVADTSISATTEDDGRSGGGLAMSSLSLPSETGVQSLGPVSEEEGGTTITTAGTVTSTSTTSPQKVKSKRQMWDELAISSVTRAFTLLYTLALLTLLTRVQLNLLGRRSYLSSVVSLATGSAQAPIGLENNDDDSGEQACGADFETNRRYLTFSWWLLNRGWIVIRDRVEAAVRATFGHLSPRDSLSLAEFARLTARVREEVESGGGGGDFSDGSRRGPPPWLECLLPPPEREEHVLRESGILDDVPPTSPQPHFSSSISSSPAPFSPTGAHRHHPSSSQPPSSPRSPSLRHLLDETADLIESAPFVHVLTLLLDAGFALLIEQKLAVGLFGMPSEEEPDGSASPLRVLLPRVLSVLTRQARVIGNGVPNEYLQEMERVRELESLAAVVYSSNWENEIRAYGGEEGATGARARESAAPVVAESERAPGLGASTWSVVMAPPRHPTEDDGRVGGMAPNPQGSSLALENAWERAMEKR